MNIHRVCNSGTNTFSDEAILKDYLESSVMKVIGKLKEGPCYVVDHLDNRKKLDALIDVYFGGNIAGRRVDPRVADSLRGYTMFRAEVKVTVTSALVDGKWKAQSARVTFTDPRVENGEVYAKESHIALIQDWVNPQGAITDAKAIVYHLIPINNRDQ